jgi:DNA-directed RNA polymerase specialized sigma24 family protein
MAALSDEQARELYPTLRRAAAACTARDGDDLVQDAFLGVLRRAELPEHLAGFLATSVRNAARSRARHERCLRVDSLDAPARFNDWDAEHEGSVTPLHTRLASPDDVAEEATTRVALGDALGALAGERYAPALVACGLGYRQAECAARAGVSTQAVKIGIHRLRHGPLARLSPYR